MIHTQMLLAALVWIVNYLLLLMITILGFRIGDDALLKETRFGCLQN